MEVNMTRRQKKILEFLKENRAWVVSSEIANKLHISSRTVRNEMNIINQLYKEPLIISLKGKGYRLADSNMNIEKVTQVPIKRHFVILKTMFINKEIDFYELADNMFISETTLEKEIIAINNVIKERKIHLIIKRKNNKLSFEGNEESKRKVYLYFLIDEIGEYSFDFNNYSNYFHSCDILKLKEIIIDFIKNEGLKINDLSLISLIIRIAIMLESASHGNYTTKDLNESINKEQIRIGNLFYKRLSEIIEFTLPDEEIYYIASLFTNEIVSNLDNLKPADYYNNIVEVLIDGIKANYQVDLNSDAQFKRNLQTHISKLDKRFNRDNYFNNPLIDDIKENFPFTYDISVYISIRIHELMNIRLVESEIGFIALHVMCAIEKMKLGNKKKIAIINPLGQSLTNYIKERLLGSLKMSLEVIEESSLFNLEVVINAKPDLIITTTEIDYYTDIPIFKCSFLLKDNDIQEIERIMELREMENRKEKEDLLKYFDRSLFFANMSFKKKEDVIKYMCMKLKDLGYVDNDFEKSVLKREEIAPTAFGNLFAIPHAAEKIALKNGIAVCILNENLNWSKSKVRIVVLFSLAKTNMNLNKLYDVLIGFLENIDKVKEIAKINNYDEFIKTILD